MLAIRWAVLLLLGVCVACFALYAFTGQVGWRRRGLTLLLWTLGAAFLFFAVLIAERL